MATVSIIVPVYNAEKGLKRCIESVLNQDFDDWELILVNDGSKDQSKEIIDEYMRMDSRIIGFHKKNSGVSSTRNKGLELAKGKYIQFMDADDYLPLDSVKLLVREMENNKVEMAVGDFYRVVEDSVSKKGSIGKSKVLTRKEYSDHMLISPADFYYGVLWNKMYRKDIIDEFNLHMDENISFCEDMIFNLEYLLHVKNIAITTAPVYYYIKTEGSLVEQSLKIDKIIEMKKNVISYYNNFYKSILDDKDYIERMPIIYAYYFAVSTDGISIPFFNGKKIGEEKGNAEFVSNTMNQSLLRTNYLYNSLLSKFLSTIAHQFSIEEKDVNVLYCLKISQKPLTISDIEDFSGLSKLNVIRIVAKLTALGYISVDINKNNMFYLSNKSIEMAMENIQNDCDNVIYKGLSEEEISQYLTIQKKLNQNIEKFIK